MDDFSSVEYRDRIATQIKADINAFSSSNREVRHSVRLSPSALGGPCTAENWYTWRWATEPVPYDGRSARYTERGNEEEAKIVALLRGAGWTVRDRDEKGEQFGVSDLAGHLYGRVDGLVSHPIYTQGQELIFENKLINYKRYSHLISQPLVTADFKYYVQICIYMLMLDKPATLFIPGNRNDDDIAPIIIPRDDGVAKDAINKAQSIMYMKTRPARMSESAAHFYCKSFCDHKEVCHFGGHVKISCRSCVNVEPIEGGKFRCNLWDAVIPGKAEMLAACPSWEGIK